MKNSRGRRFGGTMFVLGIALGSVGCSSMGHWMMTPPEPFDAADAPPAPDYTVAASWAALPGEPSRADSVPPNDGAPVAPAAALADAFFVHPSTYFWRTHWNAPTTGWLTHLITGATLAGQASVFNGVARIYAPRYRQVTLGGFSRPDSIEPSLELAYSDVRRAFLHYLETWSDDRPIILAGHSQGSRMVLRLINEFFHSGPLRERLVAAYVVGMRIWPYFEKGVPVCETPAQTGCLVSWRSIAEGADPTVDLNPEERIEGKAVCVNPINWIPGGSAPASENLGSIPLPMMWGPGDLIPGLTGARCGEGVLWVDPPSRSGFRLVHGEGNWHAYDYALFYANVRENATRRVQSFLGN